MILTGEKFEEFGRVLYGAPWVSVMAQRLELSRFAIMRMRNRDTLPKDLQLSLIEMIDVQFAMLGEVRNQLAETFDDG